ncbi:exodeoxyribonuclease VII large subunit [Desulfofundulus thermobenzoicus]|uniref:Exodeoxyribonuclease 7 large subunit n=1 Tax=Desulfofundulus thermobenzoicus TaxID=29376 RepID=A0A6N7IRI4_9FIRM|nr:exodeoxyribonuclease VII large subunit [Desulfofundulus thermobenzoicus]MQL52097.1 exodeoxyribonuclease VII large subunit [Desulfofundulus thermobenzoicus]HHW42482.1 exodeoxyribonuclease VII large subunit [Desulfotomaculum sp.]
MLRLLTVSELTAHIKNLFDNDPLLLNLWVKGEISNYKQAASGHLYFTLKDEGCAIKAVMFRSRGRRLLFEPEDGMAVRIRGYVTVYPRDGTYQLYAEEMEPEGTGALYLAFEQLKKKLEKEGLFDPRHKKKIPRLPRRIGIVTSPTGAVLRDMVKIIRRRFPGAEIIFVPVAVQGEGAPGEVVRGIQLLNRLNACDVIITGRGGGSLEELWAFNTEVVARSIFKSRIPVISAVGHETDYTIADFVADLRAPTPSAAAEMVVPVREEMARQVEMLHNRLCRAVGEKIRGYRHRLDLLTRSRVTSSPVEVLCGSRSQVVDELARRLGVTMERCLEQGKNRLAVLTGRLQALSPLATLARGYSICSLVDTGEIIRTATGVSSGDEVQVELYRGRIFCRVTESCPE